jgi:hypothetical protein
VGASTVSSVELSGVARQLAGERLDEYAQRGLGRAYEEYVVRRRRAVGALALTFNERRVPSFYALLTEPALKFETGEVRIEGAPTAPDWEFLVPFERVVLRADGSAELYGPGGAAPRRAIARLLLREHYMVRSREEETAAVGASAPARMPGLVGTIDQGITICRALPVVPLEVALLLYLAEERARYELDLVHGEVLADPRAGRLASARRVRRSSRVAWGLDRRIGRGHLSLLAARSLEVLVESNGLTSIELGHVFGGVREMVDSALRTLVRQRYATFDPRTGVYRARIEAFLPPSQPGPVTPPVPVRPELRTGVQELIAAADARATCPLCGKPLPASPSTLLCDDCAEKVGIA